MTSPGKKYRKQANHDATSNPSARHSPSSLDFFAPKLSAWLSAEAVKSASKSTLDPLEEKIFDYITKALHADVALSVTDVTGTALLGSPVTVHHRLKSLVAKGWISMSETEDGRRKQINPTEAAQIHLTKVSQCLVKAAGNKRPG